MGHKKDKPKDKSKKDKPKEEALVVPTAFLTNPEEDGIDKLPKKMYEDELAKLQVQLVRLQEWIKYKG